MNLETAHNLWAFTVGFVSTGIMFLIGQELFFSQVNKTLEITLPKKELMKYKNQIYTAALVASSIGGVGAIAFRYWLLS